jgi:hypothetical protein
MSSTPRPSYAERERERLRRFELKRSRSRSKVPGRGRGRPRLSDAELTKRCQQAQHVRRAREARQEQQRQAALPHGDAAWQARYQAAHAIAANAAPRPSYCSPEARDLLLTLADVLLENFETCPLALRSDRVVVGAYAAHADRERFRAATRCDGLTLDGVRCRLTSAHQGPNAAPLRAARPHEEPYEADPRGVARGLHDVGMLSSLGDDIVGILSRQTGNALQPVPLVNLSSTCHDLRASLTPALRRHAMRPPPAGQVHGDAVRGLHDARPALPRLQRLRLRRG